MEGCCEEGRGGRVSAGTPGLTAWGAAWLPQRPGHGAERAAEREAAAAPHRPTGLWKRDSPGQLSVNLSRRVFWERTELLRRHLAASSARPSLSSEASLGCFTPTPGKRASREGGRAEPGHELGGTRASVGTVTGRLSLQQNGSGGLVAVVCC